MVGDKDKDGKLKEAVTVRHDNLLALSGEEWFHGIHSQDVTLEVEFNDANGGVLLRVVFTDLTAVKMWDHYVGW